MWVFGVCTVERFASYWFFHHISALNAQISSTRSLRFCLQLMRQMTSLSGIFCLFIINKMSKTFWKKKGTFVCKRKAKGYFFLFTYGFIYDNSFLDEFQFVSCVLFFFWKVPKRKSALWCKKNWTWRTFKCYLNLWQNLIMSCFFPVYEGGSQLTPTIMATKSSCHSAETFNTVYCFRT